MPTTTTATITALRIAALAIALCLAACAEGQWVNHELSPRQAQIAEYQCDRQNNPFLRNSTGGNIFLGIQGMNECMRAHGFVWQSR